tara:strand:+ start:755 stop:1219 length:465 start_codon:yes stop_codon:yes gene_type:complete
MKKLIIMRGLPGSGKTHYLNEKYGWQVWDFGAAVCSADDFFYNEDGEYNFVRWKIGQAHEACKTKAFNAMRLGFPKVCISNTNVCRWEYELYVRMGRHFGYEVEIVNLFDAGLTDEELAERNVHGVPVEAIAAMRARYEQTTPQQEVSKDEANK